MICFQRTKLLVEMLLSAFWYQPSTVLVSIPYTLLVLSNLRLLDTVKLAMLTVGHLLYQSLDSQPLLGGLS
jgi:hypothetical protein